MNLDFLGDVGEIGLPEIDLAAIPDVSSIDIKAEKEDVFKQLKRRAVFGEGRAEPRCDFAPGRALLKPKKPIWALCLWRRSVKGRTLSDIKSDPEMVQFFADRMTPFIRGIVGKNLDLRQWAVVVPPPRRHKERNFATLVASKIAAGLTIPFHGDIFRARTRQRLFTDYDVVNIPPESNLIVFDDIVTTGQTLISCARALDSIGKNYIFFSGISNEM